jgi:hypothetical protein
MFFLLQRHLQIQLNQQLRWMRRLGTLSIAVYGSIAALRDGF